MLPSRLFFDDSFFKGDESIKSDIYEKDGNIVLEMEAPGYTKDDIDISIAVSYTHLTLPTKLEV